MAKHSIRKRLEQLEQQRRFLHWFVRTRFYESLTAEELTSFAKTGELPDPLLNRASRFDGLDRKSLQRLWEKDQQIFGSRTREELEGYCDTGLWPEDQGRLHYSMREGELVVEWLKHS